MNKRGYFLIVLFVITLIYLRFNNESYKLNDEEISLLLLLETAIQSAEAGGQLVFAVRNDLKIQSKGKTQEGMDDSVTTADFLSHCAMKSVIMGHFPLVKLISEEKDITCYNSRDYRPLVKHVSNTLSDELVRIQDVTVWIDPLDATHEYAEKLYEYVTTMVCIAVRGEPVIGVIHNPFTNNSSWALVGKGHSSDLIPLENPKNEKLEHKGKKIIISRSHSGTIRDVLDANFKSDFEVVIAAGAGYKALKVAKGEVDAYLHITEIKKWDICAGNAILNAVGGKMTTKYGKTLSYYNETDVVNKDGLVATLKNHNLYIGNL